MQLTEFILSSSTVPSIRFIHFHLIKLRLQGLHLQKELESIFTTQCYNLNAIQFPCMENEFTALQIKVPSLDFSASKYATEQQDICKNWSSIDPNLFKIFGKVTIHSALFKKIWQGLTQRPSCGNQKDLAGLRLETKPWKSKNFGKAPSRDGKAPSRDQAVFTCLGQTTRIYSNYTHSADLPVSLFNIGIRFSNSKMSAAIVYSWCVNHYSLQLALLVLDTRHNLIILIYKGKYTRVEKTPLIL